MRRTLITIIGALTFASSAQAQQHWVAVKPVIPVVAQPTCPAGVPVQDVQVINQAGVPDYRLARVERAAVDQSLQVRRWWGTPCLHFAQDGWKLYLKRGAFTNTQGVHYVLPTRMIVWTGRLNYEMWSVNFTHEIVETLEDPVNTDYVLNGTGHQLEVADPVECNDVTTCPTPTNYRLDGVNVTDFVTPQWYAGAQWETPEYLCSADPDGVHCPGPLIAPMDASGPYDQARVLEHPWQTTVGTDSLDASSPGH